MIYYLFVFKTFNGSYISNKTDGIVPTLIRTFWTIYISIFAPKKSNSKNITFDNIIYYYLWLTILQLISFIIFVNKVMGKLLNHIVKMFKFKLGEMNLNLKIFY